MEEELLYPIGKACRICGVSPRTLRYYEEIGLLRPDRVDENNSYRFYSKSSLRRVQQIGSLSAEGFSLQEIGQILETGRLEHLRAMMERKLSAVHETLRVDCMKFNSLRFWHALLVEGEWVLAHGGLGITAKYIPPHQCLCMESDGCGPDACTDYLNAAKRSGQSLANTLGALYGSYENYRLRIQGQSPPPMLLGQLYDDASEELVPFGNMTAVSCYHIGSLAAVGKTYAAMEDWADCHHFSLRGSCYERYVLDAYSTPREEEFVTELLLPVREDVSAFQQKAAYREINFDVT